MATDQTLTSTVQDLVNHKIPFAAHYSGDACIFTVEPKNLNNEQLGTITYLGGGVGPDGKFYIIPPMEV